MYRDLLAEQRNTIVGIDLGTSYSLVAVATDCSVRVIPSPEGRNTLPSVLTIGEDGKLVVGDKARARRVSNPQQTVSSIKRFMGLSAKEAQFHAAEVSYALDQRNDRVASVTIGGKSYTAPEISAMYLRELKRWAELDLGRPVRQCVITVPAYFNEAQRQATRDAGRIAGLEVLRIVNEPTAAALAYGLQQKQQGKIAVYDFGGGTFDISLLHLTNGVFEVLATGGDTRLGGDDIDWAVAAGLFTHSPLGEDAGDIAQDAALRAAFVDAAERAKIELTTKPKAEVELPLPGGNTWRYTLTREEFDLWARPVVERTTDLCREVMRAAGMKPEDLDEAVLVGGSSRVPLVQRMVAEVFGRTPRCDLNPDEVVALGAAVQGRILAGGLKDMLLLDVTPLSLGLETWGGAYDVLIPRNTTVPTTASEQFTTNVDGQRNILVHVLQGERELAKDNRSLGKIVLKDIPPMKAGEPRVEVAFAIDADGLLKVSAKELRTGTTAAIELRPSSGLTDDEVASIINASYANAQQDFQERVLLDRRNEAERVLKAVDVALTQTGAALEPGYKQEVVMARDSLALALKSADADAVKTALAALNKSTEELARIQMDEVLVATVKGRRLDEVS